MIESQPRLHNRNISLVNSRASESSKSSISFSSAPSPSSSAPPPHHNINAVYLFILVAFSYMVPWTAVGSLIDYYTHHYGKNYYVYLNLAFYGVGYPVSLMQQRVDMYYDIIYGSKQTFQGRLYICLTCSMFLLCILPYLEGIFYIFAVIGIGINTWVAHGCASTLAGLLKFDSPILQQIGFVLPGLFSILMIYTLDLKGGDISFHKRILFFSCACLCVMPGLFAWHFLCNSPLASNRLVNKDKRMSLQIVHSAKTDLKFKDFLLNFSAIRSSFSATSGPPMTSPPAMPASFTLAEDLDRDPDCHGPDPERYSYTIGEKHLPLGIQGTSTSTTSPFYNYSSGGNPFPMQRQDFMPQPHTAGKNREAGNEMGDEGGGLDSESRSAPSALYLNEFEKPLPLLPPMRSPAAQPFAVPAPTPLSPVYETSDLSDTAAVGGGGGHGPSPPLTKSSFSGYQPPPSGASPASTSVPQGLRVSKDWTPSTDVLAQRIFRHDPSILTSAININSILSKNRLHRLALFLTMFCSILQAAFFSYLTNVSSNSSLTLYLFFIRMFSDLIGRPLALIRPRIFFFQNISGVLIGTIIRAIAMGLFFLYIFTPKELFYRNDMMVLVFQVQSLPPPLLPRGTLWFPLFLFFSPLLWLLWRLFIRLS
jgi:hypothetical protein